MSPISALCVDEARVSITAQLWQCLQLHCLLLGLKGTCRILSPGLSSQTKSWMDHIPPAVAAAAPVGQSNAHVEHPAPMEPSERQSMQDAASALQESLYDSCCVMHITRLSAHVPRQPNLMWQVSNRGQQLRHASATAGDGHSMHAPPWVPDTSGLFSFSCCWLVCWLR